MRHILSICIAISLASGAYSALAAEEAGIVQPVVKVESVLGREVRTVRDEDGGRVIDLLFDEYGRPRAAVVEFGGFLGIGTRKIAVDWSAFRFAGSQILVDVSRDQLRTAPEFKQDERPRVVTPPKE
jgi:hypothetical protein